MYGWQAQGMGKETSSIILVAGPTVCTWYQACFVISCEANSLMSHSTDETTEPQQSRTLVSTLVSLLILKSWLLTRIWMVKLEPGAKKKKNPVCHKNYYWFYLIQQMCSKLQEATEIYYSWGFKQDEPSFTVVGHLLAAPDFPGKNLLDSGKFWAQRFCYMDRMWIPPGYLQVSPESWAGERGGRGWWNLWVHRWITMISMCSRIFLFLQF